MPRIAFLIIGKRTLDLIGRASYDLPDFPRAFDLPREAARVQCLDCPAPISAVVFTPDLPAFRCKCGRLYHVRYRETTPDT